MQIPLTSTVPSVVEITQFIVNNFPQTSWFPNWYLGVPLRFITGPIIPFLVIVTSNILPFFPLQGVYLGIIFLSWLIGTVGIYNLSKTLGAGKSQARNMALVFLLLPLHLILLSTGNGLAHVTITILPFILISWQKNLTHGHLRWLMFTSILISISLLINLGSILGMVVGLLILNLIAGRNEKSYVNIVKLLLTLLTAFSFVSIWYPLKFWLVLFTNPSFAGKSLVNVIGFIFQLLQSLIPVVLGFWVVQQRYRLSNKLTKFALLFGLSFGFLTLIRMLSDIDFWMDWIGYGLELQFSLAILLPLILKKFRAGFRYNISLFIILLLTITDIFLGWKLFFEKSRESVEYKNDVTRLINNNIESNQRIFLSGSPVFWLSAGENSQIMQVRGNRDEVSTHKTWAMGAYQIREGEKGELLSDWLEIFGVKWLLINDAKSQEYFHDFKNQKRFQDFELKAEKYGDYLYKYESSIARVADLSIQKLSLPKEGNDGIALTNYVETLKEALNYQYMSPNKIQINLSRILTQNEVISLAVTYDPSWRVVSGEGQISSDSFGNLVVIPKDESQKYLLVYQEGLMSWIWGIILSSVSLICLFKAEQLASIFQRKSPALVDLSKDEEKEY